LQIAIHGSNQTILKTIDFKNRSINMNVPLNFKPESIIMDPGVYLLFEGNIEEEK
jgi:hypothetical protein